MLAFVPLLISTQLLTTIALNFLRRQFSITYFILQFRFRTHAVLIKTKPFYENAILLADFRLLLLHFRCISRLIGRRARVAEFLEIQDNGSRASPRCTPGHLGSL